MHVESRVESDAMIVLYVESKEVTVINWPLSHDDGRTNGVVSGTGDFRA